MSETPRPPLRRPNANVAWMGLYTSELSSNHVVVTLYDDGRLEIDFEQRNAAGAVDESWGERIGKEDADAIALSILRGGDAP